MKKTIDDIFAGDSGMSALMRGFDWSSTPLGPPEQWPDGLRVPLGMMLTSRFQMWLGWGRDLAFFYNDAYAPTLGLKHPKALARPMREVWAEVFDDVADRINSVMRDGKATWDKALLLLLERSGYPEETYHTFSYSPLTGDDGSIQGLMCVVTEETDRVISERRLETLRTLATALLLVRTREQLAEAVQSALSTNRFEFPFHVLRFFNADGAPPAGADRTEIADWPFDRVGQGVMTFRTDDPDLLRGAPMGAWQVPPKDALITRIAAPGQTAAAGLVLGLNPYRRQTDDAEIIAFAELIAAQIAGAVAMVDAHAREAAEMQRLRDLFEQSPSFIALLQGPDHRFDLANPAYQRLVGRRDLLGKTVREALPEIEGQGFHELLDGVYATGEPYRGDAVPLMVQRESNAELESRILDFIYQPFRNAEGTITGVFVEGNDVTNAYRTLAALKASEERFRTFAEAMPNHVWTSRPDGTLDWFNKRVYEYSGTVEGELDGGAWAKIVHPDDIDWVTDRWATSLSTGQIYETEFRLRRADGAFRWHIARAIALRGDDGAVTGWIGTNTDIEEQKATARALANLNATLEEQVMLRTGKLLEAEEALRQSQKMEAVGQLTGGIAHDFNNMLAIVIGSLDIAGRRLRRGEADVERHLESARAGATRAATLTQRLLAFSRQSPLSPRVVNLNELVAAMSELLRRSLGERIGFETVLAGGLWPARVDPNQLESAILNLAVNAKDAMPDGGKLTIETANGHLDDRYVAGEIGLNPGQYVMIAVSDVGSGMPPDVLPKVFDPFFTTKPTGKGTGLGLSMVYGFAKQSGGHVRIYSEVGKGTSVKLYLPRHFGPLDEANAPVRAPNLPAASSRAETVLVVEDEDRVRQMSCEVLKELGYTVHAVSSGEEALRLFDKLGGVDLLFTDVMMPGMSGRQLAEALLRRAPSLKVLYTTGYTRNAVVHNGVLDPGVAFLPKPFTVEDLATKLRAVLDA
jgi:PAS domain S-box-containing protein